MSTSTVLRFLGSLMVILIGLKLTDTIGWAWRWVLAPLWIPAIVALVIVTVLVAITVGQDLRGLD